MQAIANDLSLRSELSFVSELLKVTATTAAEVRTRRLNPHRRRRKDLFNRSKQNIPLLALNSHTHTISGRGQRNKTVFPPAWANPIPPGRIRSTSTSKTTFIAGRTKRHKTLTKSRICIVLLWLNVKQAEARHGKLLSQTLQQQVVEGLFVNRSFHLSCDKA